MGFRDDQRRGGFGGGGRGGGFGGGGRGGGFGGGRGRFGGGFGRGGGGAGGGGPRQQQQQQQQHGGPPPPRMMIDRTKTCPLLLRVFVKQGAHHRIEDFAKQQQQGGQEPECIHVYTWVDATLSELADLVQENFQAAAHNPRMRLSFAFVYPDRRGRNVMRQVGLVMPGRPSVDDHKTLAELSFQTGDLLDVAVL